MEAVFAIVALGAVFAAVFGFRNFPFTSGTMTGLEIVGVIALIILCLYLLLQGCHCIYTYLIRASKRRNALQKERGRWAVVTGATDGIGKSYAHAFAKKGLKVILISRNPTKLSNCAAEITEKHKVETKIIAVDFTNDVEIFDKISVAIQGLEIGVLVNNVGISYSYPELFLDVPDKEKMSEAILRANIVAITRMCSLIMPQMVARKSGVVINISSLSCLIPSPYLTLYAASKAFVENFSTNLHYEYEEKGLVIQTVLPGYVATNMSKIRKTTWMSPSSDKFVASALSKLGVQDHTTGYFPHTLMVKFIYLLKAICKPFAVHTIKRSMIAIRSRALKKKSSPVQES